MRGVDGGGIAARTAEAEPGADECRGCRRDAGRGCTMSADYSGRRRPVSLAVFDELLSSNEAAA